MISYQLNDFELAALHEGENIAIGFYIREGTKGEWMELELQSSPNFRPDQNFEPVEAII